MDEKKIFCEVLDYNIFVYVTEEWKYIVPVDKDIFDKVLDEAKTCCRVNNLELVTEIQEDDFFDGCYINYSINGRLFAYIGFRKLDLCS